MTESPRSVPVRRKSFLDNVFNSMRSSQFAREPDLEFGGLYSANENEIEKGKLISCPYFVSIFIYDQIEIARGIKALLELLRESPLNCARAEMVLTVDEQAVPRIPLALALIRLI